MIRFNADDHTYWDGERRVASVSEVLKAAGLGPDYSAIDPDVLARAAARGIHVEQSAQLWSEGILDETSVHPEAVPYLAAFKEFTHAHRPTKAWWQRPLARDDIAGTPDLVCEIDGGWPATIDLKCVSRLDRSYRIQLAAYDWLQGDHEYHRYVLHLKKDGTWRLVNCAEAEKQEGTDDAQTWLAAVALYRWKHHGNGRK